MTGYAMTFLVLGATILWGGLIVTLIINFKNDSSRSLENTYENDESIE